MPDRLKLIPYSTGLKELLEALQDRRALKVLWLEILFNDHIPWEEYLHIPEVKEAYDKASIWYHHFKTLVHRAGRKTPLKGRKGPIDKREYRRFLEALNFVSD